MSYMFSPIHKIYPVFEYEKIEQNAEDENVTMSTYSRFWDVVWDVVWFVVYLVIQMSMGYIYLFVMRRFEVHKIVSGTLIYPIVLLNYAATEVGKSLIGKAHRLRIKFMLMMLSAEILILSLVVWHDLFFLGSLDASEEVFASFPRF